MVWGPKMETSALDKACKGYVVSRYRKVLDLTIDYLVARWRGDTIESMATTAFTAFETLISGIGEIEGTSTTIPESDVSELHPLLQDQIRVFAKARDLPSTSRGELYAKLSELRRRSIVSQAVELVTRLNVEWNDLFPDESLLGGVPNLS